jgi:PadR family transcriptional regulator PadR
MDTASWQTQLRKGAAELVVLAILGRGERYGLQILEQSGAAGEVISDGALYPLLNRLEREGKLAARWSLDEGVSHPRKYYRLTPDGEALLGEMRQLWAEFRTTITTIVEGAP